MLPVYTLQVISTGEDIISEETTRSMVGWQKLAERRLLKKRNRAQRFKEAIKIKDTIVAWNNFDVMQQVLTKEELVEVCEKVFKGYDNYFEKRIKC